jgi:mRNA-degrading endonuclease RelE of RelBE toxin-antitoxin system
MKLVITPAVEVALRTLDDDNRRRVHTWFGRLANWDGDDSVRRHSHRLESIPDAYVLRTGTDLRIFFEVHGGTVTILDIATKQSILTSAYGSETR